MSDAALVISPIDLLELIDSLGEIDGSRYIDAEMLDRDAGVSGFLLAGIASLRSRVSSQGIAAQGISESLPIGYLDGSVRLPICSSPAIWAWGEIADPFFFLSTRFRVKQSAEEFFRRLVPTVGRGLSNQNFHRIAEFLIGRGAVSREFIQSLDVLYTGSGSSIVVPERRGMRTISDPRSLLSSGNFLFTSIEVLELAREVGCPWADGISPDDALTPVHLAAQVLLGYRKDQFGFVDDLVAGGTGEDPDRNEREFLQFVDLPVKITDDEISICFGAWPLIVSACHLEDSFQMVPDVLSYVYSETTPFPVTPQAHVNYPYVARRIIDYLVKKGRLSPEMGNYPEY